MKEKDFEYCKYIELLKSQIKNLFIKIKIESDKLWVLFDIRNFLICVKESISITPIIDTYEGLRLVSEYWIVFVYTY